MAVGSLPAPDPSAGGVCGSHNGSDLRIAIVTARWNDHLTGRLLDGARRAYDHCSIPHEAVTEVWAPGSFELPLVCQQLAGSGGFDAVIAIGVVVRGETTHYDIVSEAAAVGVREAASSTGVPRDLLACSPPRTRIRCWLALAMTTPIRALKQL